MYERRKHKCEKNNGELICLSCSTPFEGLFFLNAFQQHLTSWLGNTPGVTEQHQS